MANDPEPPLKELPLTRVGSLNIKKRIMAMDARNIMAMDARNIM